MSITATPTLTVAGQPIAGLPGTDLAAVGELRLTWGRSGVLERPTPATLGLTVRDRSPGATFARRTDLIGQTVVVGWAGSDGSSGINFRGRITDVQSTPHRGDPRRGFYVTLAASSVEVDLANYAAPEGTVFPAETFQGRLNRILALLPAGVLSSIIALPDLAALSLAVPPNSAADLNTYPAAQYDAGGKSVLDLFRDLYGSTSPLPMVYDPAGNRLTYAARRRYALNAARGLTMSARLVADPDRGGRYVAAGLTGLHLDGQLTAYDGSLGQALDARITRVEVSYLDQDAGYAQATAVAATVDTPLEATIGRRTLSVTTVHGSATYAQQLAGFYADTVNNEARSPRLGSVGYSTEREPFADAAHAAFLLAGREGGTSTPGGLFEVPTAAFIGRTWLPRLGARPLVGVLGATITYSAGQWSIDLTPAPVVVDPYPGAWAPVTPAAAASSAAVTAATIDPSVTFGDMAFIDLGAGFTTATAAPYGGNHA